MANTEALAKNVVFSAKRQQMSLDCPPALQLVAALSMHMQAGLVLSVPK